MRISFFISMLCISVIANAQVQLSQSAVTASGNYSESGGYSLQSTTGEMTAVETFQNGTYYLTQGFHQGLLLFTGMEEMENGQLVFSIYPNPTSDALSVSVSAQLSELKLQILDIAGQLVYEEHVASPVSKKEVDVKSLAGGTYLLRISYTENESSKSSTLPFIIQQ